MKQRIKGVLFDLDGTLLDTAPDMALALNIQREHHGLAPLPYSDIRPYVSHGAIAMLKLGFDISTHNPDFKAMREQYLQIYADNLAVHTTLFPGLDAFLDSLDKKEIKWGIVTNKPAFLTQPLLQALKLNKRASSIISGDTLLQKKPNPAPLFLACKESSLMPAQCIYVGDAERDIAAGRAAGMKTIIAEWGYITPDDAVDEWRANHSISKSSELEAYFWENYS